MVDTIKLLQGADTSSGIKTIQDLYDLINGKSTSTSGSSTDVTTTGGAVTSTGGTTTTTENSGISQDAMNQMLQSALGSVTGLAAVSSGQRAAGGYGSSVNTMLTNDLLTKSAAAIADKNISKTTTVTTPNKTVTTTPETKSTNIAPTTTTTGGISAGGMTKAGALLAGLTQADQAAQLYKKWFGSGSTSAPNAPTALNTGVNTLEPMTATNAAMSVNDQYASYGAGNVTTGVGATQPQYMTQGDMVSTPAGGPIEDTPGSVDVASLISPETTTTTDPVAATVDIPATIPEPVSTPIPEPTVDTPTTGMTDPYEKIPEELPEFADGGMVKATGMKGKSKPFAALGSPMNPAKYADGGLASKKVLGVLGANQFNSIIDPRESLAGYRGVGFNPAGTPIDGSTGGTGAGTGGNGGTNPELPTGTNVTENPIIPPVVVPPQNSGAGPRTDPKDGPVSNDILDDPSAPDAGYGTISDVTNPSNVPGVGGAVINAISGEGTNADYRSISAGLGLLGTLTHNSTLSNLGKAGSIGFQDTAYNAGITAANIASNGALGKAFGVFNAIKDPGVANISNLLSSLNPYTALINLSLKLIGNDSIGTLLSNFIAANTDTNYSHEGRDSPAPVVPSDYTTPTTPAIVATTPEQTAPVAPEVTQTAPVVTNQPDPTPAPAPAPTPAPVVHDYLAEALGIVMGAGEDSPSLSAQQSAAYNSFYASATEGYTGSQAARAFALAAGNYQSRASTAVSDNGLSPNSTVYNNWAGGDIGGFSGSVTASAADGGHIEGPGTGISDSIHAKLSDGEFVLSADVVKAIGIDKLQALQDKYHVPAAVQRLQNFGK